MPPSLPRVDSSAILAPRPSNPPLRDRTPERQAAWWFVEWLVQQKLLDLWKLEIERANPGPNTVLTSEIATQHTSWLDPYITAAQARVAELRTRKDPRDVYYAAGSFRAMRKLDHVVHDFVQKTTEQKMPAITFEMAVEYHANLRDLIDDIDPTIKFPDEDKWFIGPDAAVWTAELDAEFGIRVRGSGPYNGVAEEDVPLLADRGSIMEDEADKRKSAVASIHAERSASGASA